MNPFLIANRSSWDERVAIHRRDATGFYDIAAFEAGSQQLHPIEAAELGSVAGKDVLHLQCHFGLDTLTLARRGARVTGLDFSPAAIAAARELAQRLSLAACFVEGNLYDAPTLIPDRFDLVYVSWGAICWLPDIGRWAEIVAQFLRPGGAVYLADQHPAMMVLEEEAGALVHRHTWRTPPDAPLAIDDATTYTGDQDPLVHQRTYVWIHPLSDLLTGLARAGLRLEFLHEHDVLPWPAFPMMVAAEDGMYRLPAAQTPLPLAFSLRASAS